MIELTAGEDLRAGQVATVSDADGKVYAYDIVSAQPSDVCVVVHENIRADDTLTIMAGFVRYSPEESTLCVKP